MNWAIGCDISHWNGDVDFAKMKAAGASFVIIKASQSGWEDMHFRRYWKAAKEAGLLRGAYHYLDWTRPVLDQAHFFVSVLMDDPGELPPVLDFEERHNIPARNPAWSAATIFLKTVELALKVKPMLYSSPGFLAEYGPTAGGEQPWPLWIAHYGVATPTLPIGWKRWEFWQYTAKGDGKLYGCESKNVDLNYFNGTVEELLQKYGKQEEPGDDGVDLREIELAVQDLRKALDRLERMLL